MSITTALPTSFKKELATKTHDLGDASSSPIGGDVFKLALIAAGAAGTYGAASTNYSELNDSSPIEEATDSNSPQGYSAGGGTLTNNGVTISGTTAYVDFADITFSSVDLSADGAIIYNSSASNEIIYVGDFGSTKTASGGDFVIQFPTADASNAIIRLA